MLTLGNGLQINEQNFLTKSTDVERIRSFLEGQTQDRISAQTAGKSLKTRLDRLKSKISFLENVNLSDQVLSLIEN